MNKKLLRKKLALMLAMLKKKRPYYCELEYIEGTGTQYIDTGIKSSGSLKAEIVAESKTTSGSGNIFGIYSHNNDCFGIFQQASTLTYAAQYRYIDTDAGRIVSNVSSPNNKITAVLDKGAFYINGNFIGSKTYYNFSSTQNLLLFALNSESGSGIIGPNPAKVYYLKLWDDGTLVRDMIPVLDWDMTPCMYDKVTGQLFYNAGTGDFTAGREIHLVEYLESTGTQYIDTGYNPNYQTEIKLVQKTPESSRLFFGCWNSTATNSFIVTGQNSPTGVLHWRNCGATNASFNIKTNDNQTHTYEFKNGNMYFDSANIGELPQKTSSSLTENIYLFSRNAGGTVSIDGGVTIYEFNITQDGTLVRDFIPAIDENGIGFMFDRVSHTIHDNAGTGAFKYPARELEYIQATGTQYLNTGWNPGANAGQFTFEVEVNCTHNTSGHGAIGSRSVDAGRNWVITNVNNETIGTLSQYGYGKTYQNVIANTSNKWSKMKTYISGNDYVFETTVDGVTYYEYTPVQSFTNTANVYLMGINNKGTLFSNFPFIGKMRRAKLYDRGTLVKDYKPAFKNGYFGLWDSVNDYMPAPSGSGTLTHGKIIEPKYE